MDPSENTDFESASGPQRIEKVNRFRRLHHIGVRGSDVPEPLRSFHDLCTRFGVGKALVVALRERGFEDPTPVQLQAIPVMLERREALICAPTGSGKTLAFLLPVIHHLQTRIEELKEAKTSSSKAKHPLRAIVLAPTIELAIQTYTQCQQLVEGLGITVRMEDCSSTTRRLQEQVASLSGERTEEKQLETLQRRLNKKMRKLQKDLKKVDILISTPKRLVDTMATGVLKLDSVEWLVFDESDRLFDDEHGCAFRDQIADVFNACTSPHVRRAMFSATTRPDVEEWARLTLDDLISVRVGKRNAAVNSVTQTLTYCGQEAGKLHEMRMLLVRGLKYPCLVFLQSRERARLLYQEFEAKKVRVGMISGDKSQRQREETMARFRAGELLVLICTDLLCRGIDLPDVKMVVNYDLPPSPLEYVHRVGRTGRAGKEGVAVTFWTDDDFAQLRPIAHLIKEAGGTVPDQLDAFLRKVKRHSGRAGRRQHLPDRGDLRGEGRRRRGVPAGGKRRGAAGHSPGAKRGRKVAGAA